MTDLHSRVHRGAYRAQPSRRVYIPKADGRQRPLGIAALEDKIVQQAVVTILNQIYEVDFKGFSYGFRPGRNQHQARKQRGAGKPETFTFLGFTHYCGTNSQGLFCRGTADRGEADEGEAPGRSSRSCAGGCMSRSSRGRMAERCRGRLLPLSCCTGEHVVLGRFRDRLCRFWRHVLRRRSQRRRPNWDRLRPTFERWIPRPRVLHPYPNVRFACQHPR